ncbi:hypothetical protein DIURU_004138 [Diutina rugosa]|uniref:Lon protease homolog, mitochondrial n=1 Tax=Diutina rugosa TaxID=5481 RepID=A0A642UJ49_DIURU|nr:uncharacterized protein DIURU_004138 [Diutina rugosa]KAA8899881.1 hypothetical protein DIURU_004138 [Diutina rugosa]
MISTKLALRIVASASPQAVRRVCSLRYASRVSVAADHNSALDALISSKLVSLKSSDDSNKPSKDPAPAPEPEEKKDTPKQPEEDKPQPENDPVKDGEPDKSPSPGEEDIEIVVVKHKGPKKGSDAPAAAAAGGAGAPPPPPDGGNNNSPPSRPDSEIDRIPIQINPDTGYYPPVLAISMKDRIPIPGRAFSINIVDPEVISAVHTIIDNREPYFALFHAKDESNPNTDVIESRDSVYNMGVYCEVIRLLSPKPGWLNIVGYPVQRCQLKELKTRDENLTEVVDDSVPSGYLKGLNVSTAVIQPTADEPFDKNSTEIASLVESIRVLVTQLASKNPSQKVVYRELTRYLDKPDELADYVGSSVYGDVKTIQELLESLNVEQRLSKVFELLKVEVKASMIKENTIHNLSSKADEYQTRLFIKEFIKELQKRAGISETENSKTSKFDARLKNLHMTEEAMEAYQSEKQKMESQNEHSSELGVSERYLDWLTSIPWGIYSKDRFNIREAKQILDRDHYGLKDVKERILEFISMGRVSGKVDGKILCLAGPPGTGKTSIAKSIAEALNRKYVRIAMGGIQDVHEVKGHRRTYVGSIPGRIIHALKQAKTSNPLMLIDEIDKLDLSRSGGAASAFLEILDPEQNNAFVDNYIDVKVDLSKVLFVCTANYLGNIPAPLRDRMEIIDVNGYTNNEKVEITKRHLIPDASKKAGLEGNHVNISDATITRLIEKYCRESGLRNIKKLITRIFSKASLKIVEQVEERDVDAAKTEEAVEETKAKSKSVKKSPEATTAATATTNATAEEPVAKEAETSTTTKEPVVEEIDQEPTTSTEVPKMTIPEDIKLDVTPENLKDYVGPEIYTRDRVYELPPPGVATGLSYSSSGNGDALYIESILTHSIASGSGQAGVHVTGSLKDVMKESASIAYSFAKSYMVKNFPENRFFEAAEIHVHCPDGAIPKDGPSAGISFTSSLMSLALNQSLPPTVAMTGEITVTGRVLPVGGLREKILGAKRYGCDTIIFPKDIANELDEIPEEVKEGVKFIPVEWYQEVFDNLFPTVTKAKGNSVWKKEFDELDEKKKKKVSV